TPARTATEPRQTEHRPGWGPDRTPPPPRRTRTPARTATEPRQTEHRPGRGPDRAPPTSEAHADTRENRPGTVRPAVVPGAPAAAAVAERAARTHRRRRSGTPQDSVGAPRRVSSQGSTTRSEERRVGTER